MGRKLLKENQKAKMRPASLKDKEFKEIKSFGKGSFTGGIREMKEITDLITEELDSDLGKAKRKLITLIAKHG